MSRLIDADAVILNYGGLVHISPYDFQGIAKYFAEQIAAAPTIDAVPVVRCSECKHWSEHPEGYLGVCSFISRNFVMKNGYCAWGERKEDDHE